jgi:primosomal protein N' (replication factor Y)
MKKKNKYVEIALPLPIDSLFDYKVPVKWRKEVLAGKRVWVPFGKRRLLGYVVGVKEESAARGLKSIYSVIDKDPIISDDLMRLSEWISEYYMCSLGEAIHNAVPGALKSGKTSVKQRKFDEDRSYAGTAHLEFTDEQKRAYAAMARTLDEKTHECFLLHGVTSSGKTEIYLQLIDRALSAGRSSIVLVPEISLTPQTIERFKSRFSDKVAVVHSRLTGGMRFREFDRIRKGQARVVVGARSALFSPVKDLGVIVIDEEQEPTYKQEESPRYHAREVALMRARLNNAVVILGTATPSMESFYRARLGQYRYLELKKRIDNRPMPRVTVVDMKEEMHRQKRLAVLSLLLKNKIKESLERKEQVILFLNRRGFSTFIMCKSCGYIVNCKRCDNSMVYHSKRDEFICHRCNKREKAYKICPACKKGYLRYFGKGTQKVESELHKHFPDAAADRMDTDATKKRGSHDAILENFKDRKLDILVGTQMIAKGLDFPQVTLVGVISADVTLNLADFRAGERTFNLLMQVGGRAGRGRDPGEVVVQTFTPEHYVFKAAREHDYEDFYNREVKTRKELSFPPFTHIIRLTCRAGKEEKAEGVLSDLAKLIKSKRLSNVEVNGPFPSLIAKSRGRYSYNLMVKTADPHKTALRLKKILDGFGRRKGGVITADVDPASL